MESNKDRSPEEVGRKKRRLGATSVEITPIGLGAWQFSQGKGGAIGSWGPLSQEETSAIVRAALEGGINWFDTAELYGFGRSERTLAAALQQEQKRPGEVVIATKWNPLLRRAHSIETTIHSRLKWLSPYPIDLHQVHFPASFSSVESEMNAMANLVESQKIKAVGVSNFGAEKMKRAHEALGKRGLVLASNQVKYSLLDRGIERDGTLAAARKLGITIIAYSPLEMGLLTGKFHENPSLLQSRPVGRRFRLKRLIQKSRPLIDTLRKIAEGRGVSVSQVALNWLIHFHGETVVTIPGASRADHALQSAKAMSFVLSSEELARLDEASRPFV